MGDADRALSGIGIRIALWFSWLVAFWLTWMLLVGTWVLQEMVAGLVAAAAAASVAELVRVQDIRQFRPRLRWILRAYRLPPLILSDSFVVLLALWRHVTGKQPIDGAFRAFKHPVAGQGGRAAGRRALLNAAISVTPNTYVVGIDEDREQVLVHQLVPCPPNRTSEEIIGKL